MTIVRLSTHVLDTTLGRPAGGLPATLETLDSATAPELGTAETDDDGRVFRLNTADLVPGRYRLTLDTAGYFERWHGTLFYPQISVAFALSGDRDHYHIAVLTSTYSFTTYLGS